jgi:hypothetical protein
MFIICLNTLGISITKHLTFQLLDSKQLISELVLHTFAPEREFFNL